MAITDTTFVYPGRLVPARSARARAGAARRRARRSAGRSGPAQAGTTSRARAAAAPKGETRPLPLPRGQRRQERRGGTRHPFGRLRHRQPSPSSMIRLSAGPVLTRAPKAKIAAR